uniref:Epoxide hydrolase N-terminal domain-containing protein n=1 Tax=Trichogramma kaykai TaxID=54128 RepID=A0ABD2WK85_9HYME
MGLLLLILLAAVGVALTTIYLAPCSQPPPVLEDTYWGPGKPPSKLDTSIRPFQITFEKQMIDDLKARLNNTRTLQEPLEGAGWTYGVNSKAVPGITEYWLNKYDFQKREKHLNKFPQFLTNIQGLDIHFIHAKPQLPKNRKIEVLPLYLQHGWPGSVVEFWKVIEPLTTPRPDRDFVFEVIAPSLPGFGYSQAAAKIGLGAVEMAHLMKNLMLRLGHQKFYVQGGDWGGIIVANMAAMYPEHVIGLHSNFCAVMRPWTFLKTYLASFAPSLFFTEYEISKLYPMGAKYANLLEESGYFHIQATKPDTVGVAMADSPAGLATYILEKFSTATHLDYRKRDDGGLLEKFGMDELLDNLMMYWAPNKAASSFRIYAETFNSKMAKYGMENVPINVPAYCAQFPNEITYQPKSLLSDRYKNLVGVAPQPSGGHFAAMEEPRLFADDVWAGVKTIRDKLRAAASKKSSEEKKPKNKKTEIYQAPVEVPKLPLDQYWGPGAPVPDPKDVKPFKINVSKQIIDDLHQRLDKTKTFVEPLEGVAWTYGVPSTYLKSVLTHWRKKYDWNKRQELLNKYPQFKTKIQAAEGSQGTRSALTSASRMARIGGRVPESHTEIDNAATGSRLRFRISDPVPAGLWIFAGCFQARSRPGSSKEKTK